MFYRALVLVLVFTLLLGCSQEKEENALPCGMPRLILINMLVELHKADATLNVKWFESEEKRTELATGSYKYILNKYDMNRSDFHEMIECFSTDLELFKEVYDEVLAQMSKE